MFAIIQGLNFLVRSKNILGDETFKRDLRPFLQFYAIFGSSESWKLPVVWVFLMRKSEGAYQNFARFWPKNALFLKLAFNVKIFWLILKLGSCRQSKKSFTSRAISDGGFTMVELGFSWQNKNNPTLHLIVCRLFRLLFLLVVVLIIFFQPYQYELSEFFSRHQNLEKKFQYITEFSISGYVSLVMWNVFDRNVTLRTTIESETWNMRWNKEVGVVRPNFWNLQKKNTFARNRISNAITNNFARWTSRKNKKNISYWTKK